MFLRFVDGRPVSAVTTQFLGWLTDRLMAEGKTALLMVWDNASWHVSQAVRAWLKAHNRRVKRDGACRIVVCPGRRVQLGEGWHSSRQRVCVWNFSRFTRRPSPLLCLSDSIRHDDPCVPPLLHAVDQAQTPW